jgi:very-short-patch-repair endonuclease
VPVVRPELLALQLFADHSDRRAERLVDRLWSMRLLSGRSIGACLSDLGERGRNGTAGLRVYLDRRGDDYVPPASGLESRVMELLQEAWIPMRRQVDSGGERWTGRVDFRHEELPLIVEVQSEAHHTALVDVEHDAARQKDLEKAGFVVLEAWDTDVWQRPRQFVADVAAAERTCRAGFVCRIPARETGIRHTKRAEGGA